MFQAPLAWCRPDTLTGPDASSGLIREERLRGSSFQELQRQIERSAEEADSGIGDGDGRIDADGGVRQRSRHPEPEQPGREEAADARTRVAISVERAAESWDQGDQRLAGLGDDLVRIDQNFQVEMAFEADRAGDVELRQASLERQRLDDQLAVGYGGREVSVFE